MKTLDARERNVAKIAEAVHQLSRDRDDVVTLTPGVTVTTILDPTVTPDTVFLFDPLTATAAAELAAGTLCVLAADRLLGSFTITHANAGSTDRTFRWIAAGD